MHFEDFTGSEELHWLTRGVPNMLLTDLAQTPGLDIVSSDRISELLKQLGQENVESVDREIRLEAGRLAGAGALVIGSIYKQGEDFRIDVQIEEVQSGRFLGAESVRGTDIFPLVDDLTVRVRGRLNSPETEEGRPLAEVTTASLEAYKHYMEGLEALKHLRVREQKEPFQRAIQIDPSFIMPYYYLSTELDRVDEELRQQYRRKVLDNLNRLPQRDRLFVESGYLYTEDPDKAAGLLERLIELYPDDEEAYRTLAGLYRSELGEHERARATIERGVKALPRSGIMHNNLAMGFLAERGHYLEAMQHLEVYAQVNPGEPNPIDSIGALYLQMGQPDRAIEHFKRALQMQPNFHFSQRNLLESLVVLGRYDDAFEELEKQSLSDDRPFPLTHAVRALFRSRQGRFEEAEEEMKETDRILDEYGIPWEYSFRDLISSLLSLESENYEEAIAAAKRSLAIELDDGVRPRIIIRIHRMTAHLLAGTAEAQLGNIDEARARLNLQRQLYEEDPSPQEKWWYHALEGEIAWAAGDLVEAEAAFRAGEPELKMPKQTPLFLVHMVWSCLSRDGLARVKTAQGDYDAAIEIYRDLITPSITSKWVAPLEPRFVLELARLYDKKGDQQSAREHYQRFLELWKNADPGLPEVEEAESYLSH
jgi:tetratricopeptide (TPR) repeat protein/TolB-like protein